jgi:digeranylgeranylglycerophospholipid reductase
MFPEIPKQVDVVVVGAGPAGSSAAKTCAENGLKVLMFEKRPEIGSPKRCGEGLSKTSLERMGIELDRSWVNQDIYGQTIYAPNGKFVRIDYDETKGWIIERKIFDKYLACKAARAGAMVLARTEVLGLIKNNNKVCGVKIKTRDREVEVRSKIVIAADGVESKLAREAGLDTTLKLTEIASSVQFEMTGIKIDPKRIELYFGNKIAPGGYVWIFPKGKDTANVGIGVRKPWAKKPAIEYLEDFINSHSNLKSGSVIEVNSGGVPVGGLLENMVADNFMVVGDAAHQVNAIHGGGISEGWVAGRIVAEVAIKAIKRKDCSARVLSEYNKKWWRERGNKLKKLVKLREVAESLSDDELNWLANYLTGQDLIDFSRASGLKKLAIILMKKPRLIKLARKLLI